MKFLNITMLLASFSAILPGLTYAEITLPNQELKQARTLVKAFSGDLKTVLKTSMTSAGPTKAIQACNVQAKPIAEKVSSLSDWQVARTSLKVRNPNNKADEWETKVLEKFESRKAAGEAIETMEYAETVKTDNELIYRYMKPIPTQGLCLTCHGETLSDDVREKITLLYPDDTATGFNLGDIRGAFTLKKVTQLNGE